MTEASTVAGLGSRLTVVLNSEEPPITEVADLVQSISLAVTGGVWIDLELDGPIGATLNFSERDEAATKLYRLMTGRSHFASHLPSYAKRIVPPDWRASLVPRFLSEFDPFNEIDVGVRLGLDTWLHHAFDPRSLLYETAFRPVRVEAIGQRSPVVVVIAVPLVVKIGAGVLSGTGAVMAAIHKYFAIQKTRAETAQAYAEARKADAEAAKFAAEVRALRLAGQGLYEAVPEIQATIRESLEASPGANERRPEILDTAVEIGTRSAIAAINGIERNTAVADVSMDVTT